MPFPPSINGYWRSVNGRQIISKRGREFRKSAKLSVMCARLTNLRLDGRLRVEIDYHPPTLRKYDVDNFSKGVLDALTKAGVWLDDEQVDILLQQKKPKMKGGQAVVRIWELVD